MAGYNFTKEAAKRIAAVVRKVENEPTNFNGTRTPQHEQGASFWAYIVDCDATGKRYSWISVIPLQGTDTTSFVVFRDDQTWTFAQPTVGGLFNALEVNHTRGIDRGTIVRLIFQGYDSEQKPIYFFQYTPPPDPTVVPPHDHRDNNPRNGGFAFSCYHPGTSLPQMEWGV